MRRRTLQSVKNRMANLASSYGRKASHERQFVRRAIYEARSDAYERCLKLLEKVEVFGDAGTVWIDTTHFGEG